MPTTPPESNVLDGPITSEKFPVVQRQREALIAGEFAMQGRKSASKGRKGQAACRPRICRLVGPGEDVERGGHASVFVRDGAEAQAHFDSAQGSGEHQVIEVAEMADAEYFSG